MILFSFVHRLKTVKIDGNTMIKGGKRCNYKFASKVKHTLLPDHTLQAMKERWCGLVLENDIINGALAALEVFSKVVLLLVAHCHSLCGFNHAHM